jgi:hypothetical protein
MRREVLALIIVLLLVGSLSVGYYGGINNRLTVTTTQFVTLVSAPRDVEVKGTFDSINYKIAGVQFQYYPCVTYFPYTLPFSCINTISANISEVLAVAIVNGYAYSANFSITVPNNENYIVRAGVVWGNGQSIFTSTAFLPLNSTSSLITNYNILCQPENQNFTSGLVFCYTHYGDFY